MRLIKIRKMAATSALAAMVPFMTLGGAYADATVSNPVMAVNHIDEQDFADKELKKRDWAKAEAALLGESIAEKDEVFSKLNLAFVYSATGRTDLAVAIYNDILAAKENPYALTRSGKPRRVKTIAKIALARLDQ